MYTMRENVSVLFALSRQMEEMASGAACEKAMATLALLADTASPVGLPAAIAACPGNVACGVNAGGEVP